MRWIGAAKAWFWWRGEGAELLELQLREDDRKMVQAAIEESATVRTGLARLLSELDRAARLPALRRFAGELPIAESPEQALLRVFRWLMVEQ